MNPYYYLVTFKYAHDTTPFSSKNASVSGTSNQHIYSYPLSIINIGTLSKYKLYNKHYQGKLRNIESN